MQKFISKNLFWIFQIIGWFSFSTFMSYVAFKKENLITLSIIILANFIVLVSITSLLRWSLNKFVSLKNFNFFTLLKIIALILATVIILPNAMYYLGYGLGFLSGYFGLDDSDLKTKDIREINSFFKYFLFLVIISGWTIFFYVIKLLRTSNEQRLKRLRLKDEVKQAQINTLKGHLNPQFIFTSLNNIKGLMLEDVPRSRAMLTTLSEMLRYSLTKNNINFVRLEEELTIVENYSTLLKIEDVNRFSLKVNIDPETLNFDIPPMLLSNLIELATKFGVLALKNEGEVEIVTYIKNQTLQLKVIHNGKAIHNRPRLVLESTIKQRLKLIYGEAAIYMSNYEINKNTLWLVLPIKDSN
jgi:sensor histidine kinase YesM